MNRTSTAIQWNVVRGVIFDMDGTLYRQGLVRVGMALKLLFHVITNRHGWLDLLVLIHFRRNRESLADSRVRDVSRVQFKATAQAYRLSEDRVAAIVREWMEMRPLSMVRMARYKDVERVFGVFEKRGVRIGVFSDYPATEKLKALDLKADALCCSTASEVDRLKPEPTGLVRTIEMLDLKPNDCVMIGDRMERDGQCAASLAVPFILCKGPRFYTHLLDELAGN